MPFDNPPIPNRFIVLLRDVKGRIASPNWWAKGYFVSPHGGICLVQSILYTCGRPSGRGRKSHVENHLVKLLAKELPLAYRLLPMPRRQKLIVFNDIRRTNHAQVVDLVDRAISRLELTT